MSLPQSTQEYLDGLRGRNLDTLTEDELAFLRARSEYLTRDEVEKFELDVKSTKPAGKGAKAKATDEDAA